MNLLGNPIAVMFLSFIVGMIGNSLLGRLAIYERFGNQYLFSGSKPYERLGVLWYRRILLASPARFFNTEIRFTSDRSIETLDTVKRRMTNAEVSHWVAFAAMLPVSLAAWWYRGLAMAVAHLIFNLIGNLYPCLLQQYNRRRLARVINAVKQRKDSVVN